MKIGIRTRQKKVNLGSIYFDVKYFSKNTFMVNAMVSCFHASMFCQLYYIQWNVVPPIDVIAYNTTIKAFETKCDIQILKSIALAVCSICHIH